MVYLLTDYHSQLSITEYRKRKQLSSDSDKTSPTKTETSSTNVNNAISNTADSTSEQTENTLISPISKKSSDDKVTGKKSFLFFN